MIKTKSSNAEGSGSIPGWGTKIPRALEQLSLSTAAGETPATGRERALQPGPHGDKKK